MFAASAVGGAGQSKVGWNLLLLAFTLLLFSRPCQILVTDRYFLCLQASHTQIRGSLETKEDIEPVSIRSKKIPSAQKTKTQCPQRFLNGRYKCKIGRRENKKLYRERLMQIKYEIHFKANNKTKNVT